MANQYLKPQIPLKDLNSEDYFYPLTTLDQIIIGNSRLSAYFSEENGKLIFNNIDEDSVGGSIKLDGITTNRALFVENDSLLSSENIFINNDSLAINTTSITSGYNFEVNGNGLFNGLISASSFFGALAEEELDKTDIRTWCDTVTNIHKSSYQGDMVLKRFYSQDEPAADYNLPCVDSHMMIFSLSHTSINWTRILALDMRSPILFIGGKSNGDWQTWTQLITDNTAQTITNEKTFTTDIAFNTNTDLGIIQSYYNGTKYNILRHHNNGNVSLSAESSGLYLGYQNTTFINFLNNRARLQDGCLYLLPNNNNYREGIRIYACNNWSDIILGGTDLTADTGTSANTWFIGNNNGTFNIVRNGSSTGTAYFRCVNNKWYANTTSGNEQLNVGGWVGTVGNTGWYNITHGGGWYMVDTTWIRNYGSKAVYLNNQLKIDGYLYAKNGHDFVHNTNEFTMIPDGYNNTLWFNYETITRKNNGNLTRYIFGNGKHGYAEGIFSKLYNAVWNDYAEFRKADIIKPGSVIKENGDGSMSIVEKRLEPSARIISDTYGVAIGENQENNAPIAVAGRVLVYPYQDRNNYKPGMSVCAAPGGTVDIMSREEIREYPDCIIGIVSEIPNYDIWYAGNYKMKKNSEEKKIIENPIPIQVNGRIWVYVR